MPQPYRGTGNLTPAATAILERPFAPAMIASIASLWTFSEEMWGIILSSMLGIQAEAGLAMYHSLTGTSAQRAVLNEMAGRYLDDELQVQFRALMRAMKGRATERNDMVHGLWFYDPDLPNALVLAPRNTISMMWSAGQSGALSSLLRATKSEEIVKPSSYEGWLTYQIQDFAAANQRMLEFLIDQDDLFDKILAAKGLPPFGPPARPAPPAS